jgi:hypothetical protein
MDPTMCHLCGSNLHDGGPRCPNCGLHSVVEVGRALYSRVGAGLAGVYGLTALVVLLTR